MWSVGPTMSVALYGSHERSNVLQLKKSLANRKPLQKHTKHNGSWIKINGNRKQNPSQPWCSCLKPVPLQSFTFFDFCHFPSWSIRLLGPHFCRVLWDVVVVVVFYFSCILFNFCCNACFCSICQFAGVFLSCISFDISGPL